MIWLSAAGQNDILRLVMPGACLAGPDMAVGEFQAAELEHPSS